MGKTMKAMKATTTGVLKRVKAQKSLSKTITVGGKKYDKEMILAARRATRGAKNVVVSMQDAKQIFEAARPDGNSTYDKLEKALWHTFVGSTSSPRRRTNSCANWFRRLPPSRR